MSISLKRKGTLFVLSAPSGGGKSTVLHAVLKSIDGLSYSVSVTSRKPRKKEVNRKDYYFVSVEEFKELIEKKAFYEWAEVHGNYYGTRISTVDRLLHSGSDVVMDIDVQGASNIKKIQPAAITIFLLPPSTKILETRLRRRDTDDDEEVELRMQNAAEEIANCLSFDYLVVNDDLMKRLRAGSRDAAKRRGKFVE